MQKIITLLAMVLLSGCTILEPNRWPRGTKEIVLTFDDGPSEVVSSDLLDVLKKHEVKAVFCYIGKNIEKYPELAERALAEGHVIASHTYSHTWKSLTDKEALFAEQVMYEKLLAELPAAEGFELRLFRPPLGLKTPPVKALVDSNGFDYAYVTFFLNDVKIEPDNASEFMERIKKKIQKYEGAAIVLHEMRYKADSDPYEFDKSWLPGAVDDLIRWANAEGYRFVIYPKESSALAINENR